MSHTSAPSAAASATAVVSEPPRPSVVTSRAVLTPWKPATSTIRSSSSAWWMRSARTSRMRALVWDVSVTIPACEPVREIALWPRSLIAIAHSAHEIRSPVESSMSISRGSGAVETSSAIDISSSVVFPRADRTATTRWPCSRAATIRRAARLMRSASATEVPPNFITTVPDTPRSLGATGIRCPGTAPGQVDELTMRSFKPTMSGGRDEPREAGVASIFNRIGAYRAAGAVALACAGVLAGAHGAGAQGQPVDVYQQPWITGDARVGSTLKANGGAYRGPNGTQAEWQWWRCPQTSSSQNCRQITAGQSANYTLTSADYLQYVYLIRRAWNGSQSDYST